MDADKQHEIASKGGQVSPTLLSDELTNHFALTIFTTGFQRFFRAWQRKGT